MHTGRMLARLTVASLRGESAVSSLLEEQTTGDLEDLLIQCEVIARELGPTHRPGTINPGILRSVRELIEKEVERRGGRTSLSQDQVDAAEREAAVSGVVRDFFGEYRDEAFCGLWDFLAGQEDGLPTIEKWTCMAFLKLTSDFLIACREKRVERDLTIEEMNQVLDDAAALVERFGSGTSAEIIMKVLIGEIEDGVPDLSAYAPVEYHQWLPSAEDGSSGRARARKQAPPQQEPHPSAAQKSDAVPNPMVAPTRDVPRKRRWWQFWR